MTPREILKEKVFLTVADVMTLNNVKRAKAYSIIQQINDTKALKGQCSVKAYCEFFGVEQ